MIPMGRVRTIALAIVVCFLGATLALAFPRDTKPKMTVTAYFTKAIGLFPQSKVRVLGVAIGKVASVHPEGSRVRVVMKLDPERKIPADARAVIVPISLIADRYIQLTPVYSSGPALKNGDVIDTVRTSIPFELDDLLSQLKKLLDAVQSGTLEHPESIAAAVKNLADALAGAGPDLSTALTGAGKLSGTITKNAAQVDALIGELSRLLAALSQRRGEIAALNVHLAQALGAIATEHATLDSGLGNIALLTEQLGSLVKAHRPALEDDLSVLAKTTQAVIDHQDSVIRSLLWLPVLADGADDAHNGGAVHVTGTAHPHIDVRDAHIDFPCPTLVPSAACLLLALTGNSSLLSALMPAGATAAPGGSATAPIGPAAQSKPSGPDPTNLLNLLPNVSLPGLNLGTATPAPTPSSPLRRLFDRLGGWLDMGLGWVS